MALGHVHHAVRACALVALLAFSGCASLPTERDVAAQPRAVPDRLAAARPTLALVLSGGSARGFAHVGVIKVLEAQGIRPHLVVGTSAGSVVGALYAAGMSAEQLVRAAAETDWSLVSDLNVTWAPMGLLRGERLQDFVNRQVNGRLIEMFPTPFVAVAADLQTGKLAAFNRGDAGKAVRASSAVPGVFAPVRIEGRLYADGSLASPMPVGVARAIGADVVVAVDVIYPSEQSDLTTPWSVLFQTFLVQTQRLKELEAPAADVRIVPAIPPTSGQLTFADREMLIRVGEAAAHEALPAIRAALVRAGASR